MLNVCLCVSVGGVPVQLVDAGHASPATSIRGRGHVRVGLVAGVCRFITGGLVTGRLVAARRFSAAGFRPRVGSVKDILPAAGLEVGLIPTATLEPECSCRNQLVQLRLVAVRTILQGRVTYFLQLLEPVATGTALILINWHCLNFLLFSRIQARREATLLQGRVGRLAAAHYTPNAGIGENWCTDALRTQKIEPNAPNSSAFHRRVGGLAGATSSGTDNVESARFMRVGFHSS